MEINKIAEKKENGFSSINGVSIYLFSILALIALNLVFSFAIISMGLNEEEPLYNTLALFASLSFQLAYFGIFILYIRYKKIKPDILLSFKSLDAKNKNDAILKHIILAVVFYLICIICFYPISFAFIKFLEFIGYELSSIFSFNSALDIILVISITVALAPIMEELICRSGLLSGLNKRFNNIASALLCALAFSLMHMSPQQTIFQVFLGFCSALLALSCRSIIPSIILHSLSNSVVIFATFVPSFTLFDSFEALLSMSTFSTIFCAIIFTLIGLALIFIIVKYVLKLKDEPKENKEKEENRSFYTTFFLGLGICVFMWITQFVYSLSGL